MLGHRQTVQTQIRHRRHVCHGLFVLSFGDIGRICSVFVALLSRVRLLNTQYKKTFMLYAIKGHDQYPH